MADYVPAYQTAPVLTVEHFEAGLEELPPILAYATGHDDVLVLDELFCRIVALEHRIMAWEREHEQRPRVAGSLKQLDRALKWAWLARDEEDHAGGMYVDKLKEAIEVLDELRIYLQSERQPESEAAPAPGPGMTWEEAEALAATIKTRLPQAEVEVKRSEGGDTWVVEARNPRRGTSQVFLSADQFERLMNAARRP